MNTTNQPMNERKGLSLPLLIGIGVLLALFVYGAVMTLLHGHDVWGTTDEFPWGILISGYVFFAVGCTGICMLSTLGHRDWILKLVFGENRFKNMENLEDMGIKPIVLAISFMITAFAVLVFELMYPVNLAIFAVLSPNMQSAFIWMGYLYGIYLLFLILEVVFYVKRKEKALKTASFLAITTGIIATSNLGAVFGTMPGRAFWTAPYLPILFIFTALLTGAAALMVLYYFQGERSRAEIVPYLSKLLVLFIIVVSVMTAWNIVSGVIGQYPERYEATMHLVSGGMSVSFWVFEVLLGLALPLALILVSRTPKVLFAAAVFALVGMMFARHNLVTTGQAVLLQPDQSAPVHMLTYIPTFVEMSMIVGALGVLLTLYFLISKVVRRFDGPKPAVQETTKKAG
ncbi:NrfD/PsrC family molybdoenzyme membrane anchor subunit [Salisediminibacterium halotolerans]|uniref:Prokaryotic molybdopterin-containing oxidoreductase family, membrane subunit n=1 Tax=Salisediminibacterium halotolerans TaxID=517425 RepID=A0A1H9T9H6_9BACI|nr:NrfD/PsrC family molybdoenzyme membrane anchor subunit [Salisediminibacterium haloalkalitolerans]SER93905.1 prokaryotic molybdopterin-containing oxidoreductase family, membrane subunit [Salisediminibacterium haloalkalitolerans]